MIPTIPPPPLLPNIEDVRVKPTRRRTSGRALPVWKLSKIVVLTTILCYLGYLGWLSSIEGWALLSLGFGIRHLITEK